VPLVKQLISTVLLGVLAMPVWAAESDEFWFARAGILAENKPQMEPLKIISLTYGHNVSRDTSFELDAFSGIGSSVASKGDGTMSVSGVSGFITKRVVLSQAAYLKGKLGGAMLDKRFSASLNDYSGTKFSFIPGVGAGTVYHGGQFRRLIVEAEISRLDADSFIATLGVHLKF